MYLSAVPALASYGSQLPLTPFTSFVTLPASLVVQPSLAPSAVPTSQISLDVPTALQPFPDQSSNLISALDQEIDRCPVEKPSSTHYPSFSFDVYAYLKSWCRVLGIIRPAWVSYNGCRNVHSDGTAEYTSAQGPLGIGTDQAGSASDHIWTKSREGGDKIQQNVLTAEEIPQYVLDYAPYVHLYSGEQFWPCDMVDHLIHTTPHLNYTPLQAQSDHPSLTDLNQLNHWGRNVYLTSDDNVEDRPDWLGGKENIPSPRQSQYGEEPDMTRQSEDDEEIRIDDGAPQDRRLRELEISRQVQHFIEASGGEPSISRRRKRHVDRKISHWQASTEASGGRSDAPAVLVVVDKGNGLVDAFWFFFYCFNLGNVVLNVRFGNHVGDWEHMVVRFQNGSPQEVWYSEHSYGAAYTYDAVEKIGKRPVGYSATGTHAMYATPGPHPYVLPWGLLHDTTDRGPLWDPALNSHTYTYDLQSDTLRASNITPQAPTEWFNFFGHWGDKTYPMSDSRQYKFAGQYHYGSGPMGPKFKNLGRRRICLGRGPCVVRNSLDNDHHPRLWDEFGGEEQMSEEDAKRFLPEEETL